MSLATTQKAVTMSQPQCAMLNAFIRPGVRLLPALRLRARMALIVAMLGVPLLVETGLILRTTFQQYEDIKLELLATPVIPAGMRAVAHIQTLRGLTPRQLAGEQINQEALREERQALSNAVAALDTHIQADPLPQTRKIWTGLRPGIDAIAQGEVEANAQASFQRHSETVEAVRQLVVRSAEESGLLRDPEAQSFHLTHLLALRVTDRVDDARSVTAAPERAKASLPEGLLHAYAGNAAKVGSSVRQSPGVDGDKLIKNAFSQVEHGGSWVDYVIHNPTTGVTESKTSYVEGVAPGLLIGCGIYKTMDQGEGMRSDRQGLGEMPMAPVNGMLSGSPMAG